MGVIPGRTLKNRVEAAPAKIAINGLTVFLGGAGMRGDYQADMVKALKEAGIKKVVQGNYSAFFKGYDENLPEELDMSGDASAVIFYNQDENDPIALQFIDTRGCTVGTEVEFLNFKYRSYNGKTIKNEDCPTTFRYELETPSQVSFTLQDIGVSEQLPQSGQFNFIGYSWGSVIAARTAIYYARQNIKVDHLVLIGSPINDTLLQAVQNNPNIKKVIVLNLGEFGDPIYAGMTDWELVNNALKLKNQMEKGEGHFYYSINTAIGSNRRKVLAKELYTKGLR